METKFLHGKAIWKKSELPPEKFVNTGMTGLPGSIYRSQLLCIDCNNDNNVHIGNYGVKDGDVESDSQK